MSLTVKKQPDPARPGYTAYLVTGTTPLVVQAQIEAFMAEAEEAAHGGMAQFQNPKRAGAGWQSYGYVHLNQRSEAA